MAAIYRPTAAFDVVKILVKNLPIEDIGWQILDRINKMIWMAAPWRWTLGSMPAVTLASTTQDYTVTLPADFLYATHGYITEGEASRPVSVVPFLTTDVGQIGYPNQVAFTGTPGMASGGTARVAPKPGTIAATTQKLFTTYKKTAPNITNANQSNAGILVMDDEWFWVYESGVLWLAYMYADDQRAGEAAMDKAGQYRFSGQRGTFETNLQIMKDREKMPDVSIFPTGQTQTK